MLTDTNYVFNLTMPSPMPAYLTVHYICETASRLLFLSIHWARNIPAFQLLRYVVSSIHWAHAATSVHSSCSGTSSPPYTGHATSLHSSCSGTSSCSGNSVLLVVLM